MAFQLCGILWSIYVYINLNYVKKLCNLDKIEHEE